MSSQAEEQRIAEFIERVRNMPERKARMVTLAELSWIHNRRKPDGEKFSKMFNRKTIISYRNSIRAELGEESPILKTMHFSDARVNEYKAHAVEVREAQHRNQRPLDADQFVTAALLELGNVVEMRWSNPGAIAALCALTGRRPYEVAVTGKFTPVPGNKHEVMFSGQAKTRDEERAEASFVIPILADRDKVLEGLDILRSKIDPAILSEQDSVKRNKMFNQKYAKEIGLKSKKVFVDADGESLKPSDLRDAYAIVAFDQFAPNNVSSIQYMNDILGHKTESLDTTLYYVSFYLV